MAEFAQLRKEKWTESLDALRKTKLLNSDELMKLVRKLHDFEYKIQSPNRTLEDVLGYIEYECLLLKTIQQRRMELKQFERTDEIDRFIFMEIQSQFGSAEINFRHKIEFWNSRLKFVADIVPVQDRENELNKTFKKALEYCGRGNFDLYKYVVSCQWSFLNLPQLSSKKNRKRKKTLPKDCPRLMSSIRDITTAALRNFDRRPEVYIWAYLQYDVEAEVEKTVGVVHVVYSEFLKVFAKESMRPYFQLYDLYTSYQDIPETKHLLHKINGDILSVEPRTSEIYEWLMNKSDSTDEDTIRKSLEIITEALSNMPTNAMLDICIGRVNTLLQQITASGRLTLLLKYLNFVLMCIPMKCGKRVLQKRIILAGYIFKSKFQITLDCWRRHQIRKTIEALESMYKNYPSEKRQFAH
ncbi:U3 small nucleolar RNA-associated protein 6 [Orchesella cincta]|uniref:U3 small nucleolar RNA-associated protein 6 n=1 Tax=Orchesella cincta TaxID=48709 RepID=A0A1D2MBZ1_ORCCI|nr:U3 small nucleolar RNA-associated protein 6 [Orchesella cincta]